MFTPPTPMKRLKVLHKYRFVHTPFTHEKVEGFTQVQICSHPLPPGKGFSSKLHWSQEWSWKLEKTLKSTLKILIPELRISVKYELKSFGKKLYHKKIWITEIATFTSKVESLFWFFRFWGVWRYILPSWTWPCWPCYPRPCYTRWSCLTGHWLKVGSHTHAGFSVFGLDQNHSIIIINILWK